MDSQRDMIIELTKDRRQVEVFLQARGLSFDGRPDYVVGFFRGEEMIGTGSLSGRVLRNIAVREDALGEGLMLKILSVLMSHGGQRGIHGYQLFTKPENIGLFQTAGFRLVAKAEPYAALLEFGPGGVADFCFNIKEESSGCLGKRIGALVMNCNPFTLGHRCLVEYAAKNSEEILLFVVEEDRSVFPFADRLELVRQGVRDLANVHVFPGGDYIISAATFPSYFLKEEDKLPAQTLLDATVFAERIAPPLGITARYVAEEPEDNTTRAYNEALLAVLPPHGVSVEIIERLRIDGRIVSASKVRKALRSGDWATVKKFLPATTFAYLQSEKGREIIKKIGEV